MQHARRKLLGAYYTPSDLARFLAEWCVTARGQRVLEPSVGNGALVSAVLNRFEDVGLGAVLGCEVNGPTIRKLGARFADAPVTILKRDFLSLQPSETGQFDAIVANPPFTRNHALPLAVRKKLKRRQAFRGLKGAPGLWAYFLLHSTRFLKVGGKLAFIVPGAANFADYASSALDELQVSFSDVEVVDVVEAIKWDGDAQERASLILASGYKSGGDTTIRRTVLYGRTLASAPQITKFNPLKPPTEFGAIAQIGIGVVTGRNALFLLNRETAETFKVPKTALIPAASRARHVRGLTFDVDAANRLAEQGERTLMLYPSRGLGPKGSSLRRYLATLSPAERKSILWLSKRTPWWRVQLGEPCDAFLTYMNGLGPRLTLASPGVYCTNTLHKVTFLKRDVGMMRKVAVSMLSTYTQYHAEMIGRVYGGGVLKLEPKDAKRLPLLLPNKPLSSALFNRINTAIMAGAVETAQQLVNEFVFPEFFGSDWMRTCSQMVDQITVRRSRRRAIR